MSLPDWLDPLWLAEEMRAADDWAVSRDGIASLDLMERAGEGLASVVSQAAGDGPLRVVIGSGNNGGDGLVAARLLRSAGRDVQVLAAAALDRLEGDALTNLERLAGPAPEPFAPELLEGSGIVVDALLGTGFSGLPRGLAAAAIAAINAQAAPVVACDVPSGVDASSGEVAAEAVHATATATFHGEKLGLRVAPGAHCAGAISVVAIGIGRGAPAPANAGLISDRALALVPARPRSGSKFISGIVVIAGGSRGLSGAPRMAALASMRAGAGYVQLAVPASTQATFELALMEAMTRGLADEDGAHGPAGVDALVEMAAQAGCVVLGPGLGRSEGAMAFARAASAAVDVPMLIDADGLNAYAGVLESLGERRAATVLTPHAGEMGRLLGRPSSEVEERRLEAAREAALRSGAVVVLKGDDSIVAAPGGPVAVSRGATPALATAGTGDVLSGIVGALLAKGFGPFEAAAAGVLAHARAGRVAAERHGADHTIAGDVIEAIGAGMRAGP